MIYNNGPTVDLTGRSGKLKTPTELCQGPATRVFIPSVSRDTVIILGGYFLASVQCESSGFFVIKMLF